MKPVSKLSRLSAGLILLTAGVILYRQIIPIFNLIRQFPLNDFSVYLDGVRDTIAGENPYLRKYFDRYNYSPAASVLLIPLVFIPTDMAELTFTAWSIGSLWATVGITLKLLSLTPTRPIRWLLFALMLKTFPVKLTLALGQINLLILYLVIKSYKDYTENHATGAGFWLGIASILKLTPMPLILFFAVNKQYRLVFAWLATTLVATLAGIIVFGTNLTSAYWTRVVPKLIGEVTPDTLNLTYMNQSVTALLGRMGVFGNINNLIRLGISGGLAAAILPRHRMNKTNQINKISKINRTREFGIFWNLVVVIMLILPVFVWQHHYVVLIPVWLMLVHRAMITPRWLNWAWVAVTYLALNSFFPNSNLLAKFNPFVATHFLVMAMGFLILNQRAAGIGSQK